MTLFSILISTIIFFNDAQGLKVGEKAPNFSLVDQNGNTFTLSEKLESGPVIVSFYRGSWCRYCMGQLKNYQDSLAYLDNLGVQVIAISPEHEDGIKKSASISKAEFSIAHDDQLEVMLAYGAISEEKRNEYLDKFKESGDDNQHKYLPVPSTYLIGEDGFVKYVYFDPNYKVRPTVSETVAPLTMKH